MSVVEKCTISISTSLAREAVVDLLESRGPDDAGLSESVFDRLRIHVWPWHTSHWPNERIGEQPHLEVGISGFTGGPGSPSRRDTAIFYSSRILRLRLHDAVEAGLATDSIYAAWTFWSPRVTAVVHTDLPGDVDPGMRERLALASEVYLPEIESRYRQQAITVERRTFVEGWEMQETDQHSMRPLN